MEEPISVSVIMPCFNEAKSVADVLLAVDSVLSDSGCNYELIVVDDGSTDNTSAQVTDSGVTCRLLNHNSNRGYGSALKTGVRAAVNDYVAFIDADGQHKPEELRMMLGECRDCDMVIGARKGQGSHY